MLREEVEAQLLGKGSRMELLGRTAEKGLWVGSARKRFG